MQPATRGTGQQGVEPDAIAIIGMSCRFPGAVASPSDYWQLVRNGRSGIVRFTKEELRAAGQPPEQYGRSDYVMTGAVLDDVEHFDRKFFGFDRKDLDVMDPQHRLLLQGVWEALEDAGYGSPKHRGDVGLFAGCGVNEYYLEQVVRNAGFERVDDGQRTYGDVISNEKDYLVSKVAYLLNLKGPAVNVQTACSTSLVAAHYAVQSLRLGECELAVAGGVTVKVPHRTGYRYYADSMRSLSGECRVFDEHADGTVLGNGLGLVVLKPLRNAARDRDHIYAVIKGSAVNNDGDNKVSFQAPAISGQERVIVRALENAKVHPQTIQYLEAHGTGTKLGDPIEVAAATKAYGRWTKKTQYCALGSVKSNIGHAEAAAGVAGLMKAALSLYHQEIPPTLNFKTPNPALSLSNSPFYVNATLRQWPGDSPRRAAVSSFGVGGTNAHMVLEEAPGTPPAKYDRKAYALPISAKTAQGLLESEHRLADHIERHPDIDLAEVAYTLAVGREAFSHRSVIVARDARDCISQLTGREAGLALRDYQHLRNLPVAFLLPPEGEPASAGRVLYESEPRYRDCVDVCLDAARASVNVDVDRYLGPAPDAVGSPGRAIRLFIMEYALAIMWMAHGVRPRVLVGQGVGEYAAACLAGVITIEEALRMLAKRAEVRSGDAAALGAFKHAIGQIQFKPAKIPLMLSVTGKASTRHDLLSAEYWAEQVGCTGRLADSIAAILDEQSVAFLETGPGTEMSAHVRRLPNVSEKICIPSSSVLSDGEPSGDSIDSALARLWLGGVNVDWEAFYGDAGCRRIPLPTYPFVKERHWVDKTSPAREAAEPARPAVSAAADAADGEEERFYLPVWKRLPFIPDRQAAAPGSCLVFDDGSPLAHALTSSLSDLGITAVVVTAGSAFARIGRHAYVIDPANDADYYRVLQELVEAALTPRVMLHLWGLGGREDNRRQDIGGEAESSGFWSLHSLVKAWTRLRISTALYAGVLSSHLENVNGSEMIVPENSLVLGACQAIRHELSESRCTHFDMALGAAPSTSTLRTVSAAIVGEVLSNRETTRVAYRDGNRWVLDLESIQLADPAVDRMPINAGGVYWITGGTGGIGLEIAKFLTEQAPVTIVLIQRTAFPPRQDWDSWSQQGEQDTTGRTIRRILSMQFRGSTVIVERADVTDAEAMRALYEKTLKEHGGLNGVIHAAGVPGGGLLALKSRDDVRRVLAPKVAGTKALHAALHAHPGLDLFVLCSSVTALAGGAGRSDYAAANAFLDAFSSECRRRGQISAVSINWDAWKETGMAAAHRNPPRHGDEGDTARQHPLPERQMVTDDGTTVFRTAFNESADWVVRDHRIYDVPTVPGAAYIEMMAAALLSGKTQLEIRGLAFRHPLALTAGEAEAFMEVRAREEGYGVRIFSTDPAVSGKAFLHAEATAVLVPDAPASTIDLKSLTRRLPVLDVQAWNADGGDRPADGPLQLGPAWRINAEECRASGEELLVRLELPDGVGEPSDAGFLHVSLFDVATSYAIRYLSQGQLYLPLSYEQLRIHGKMPRRVYSHVRYHAVGTKAPEIMKFDVSICDVEGAEIVSIFNFAVKKAADVKAYQRSTASGFDVDPQLVVRHRDQYGLSTRSALRAFSRVIAERSFPQIVVSAGSFRRAARPERDGAAAPGAPAPAPVEEVTKLRPRPDLSTQYAAPFDDMEKRIAQIWQAMLGIELVGANDDYTELGGDSLIAADLVDTIAAEFNVEISIVSLYETLTVRELSRLVRESPGCVIR